MNPQTALSAPSIGAQASVHIPVPAPGNLVLFWFLWKEANPGRLLITPFRSTGLFVGLRITHKDAQGYWDIKNVCSFKKEKGWFGFWWGLECFVSLMPYSWHFVIAFCSLAFPWHMNMLKKIPARSQWASLNFQTLELWSSLPLSTGGWPCQILIAYVNIW